eukprot:GILK01014441.1.p1 GENE.GILK01014441.1~~GILK01014441.1.p1  ORF type:complete len:513 (+),score=32.45 GILK01014441.1:35-1573(+)
MAHVLAIDNGSSSVRACVYDCNVQPLEHTAVQVHTGLQPNGSAHAATFVAAVEQAVDSCLEKYRQQFPTSNLAAVGLACFAMSMIGVDAEGEPVTDVLTYADTTSINEAKELQQEFQQKDLTEALRQATGVPLHTAYAPAQLTRLSVHSKDLFDRVRRWRTFASHLLSRWSGREAPVSFADASWTGLFNRVTLDWDSNMLNRLDLSSENLPEIKDYTTPVIGLHETYRKRWPELAEVPFFLGVPDGAAAHVGSGCCQGSQVSLTLGTSAAIRVLLPVDDTREPFIIPQGLWCYRLDAEWYLVGGALTDGGSIFEWAVRTFNVTDIDQLTEELSTKKPEDQHITVLPFLNGERSPGWNSESRLTMFGMTAKTTTADLVYGMLEGVSLRLKSILDLVKSLGPESTQIIVSGNALARSAPWRQITANVLQQPLLDCPFPEATCRGAAVFALRAVRQMQSNAVEGFDFSLPTSYRELCQADAALNEYYQEKHALQSALYDQLFGPHDHGVERQHSR